MAISEVIGMALDTAWLSIADGAAGGFIALGTTGLTEAWDIAAMISVKVLLE
jgi:hypothetical protein